MSRNTSELEVRLRLHGATNTYCQTNALKLERLLMPKWNMKAHQLMVSGQ